MSSLSSISNQPNFLSHFSLPSFSFVSLSKRVLAVSAIALLTLSSGVAAAGSTRRYEGGVTIPNLSLSSYVPCEQHFGPYVSAELSCHIFRSKFDLSNQKCTSNSLIQNSFSEFSSSSLTDYTFIKSQKNLKMITPHVNAVSDLNPFYANIKTRFPKNFSAFMYNEIGLVDNGNRGCKLNENPEFYPICSLVADRIQKKVIEEVGTRIFNEEVLNQNSFDHTGREISFPNEPIKVHYGMDPQKHANYRHAISFLEKELLENVCFFQKSPEEILKNIKHIHQLLFNELSTSTVSNELNPGEYRTQGIVVFIDKNSQHDIAHLKDDLINLGATKKELNAFSTSLLKLKSSTFDAQNDFTKAELAVWSKLAYFPPTASKIEDLMNNFAVNLKKFAELEVHPVALAAWAHCEVGKIHPFGDGNGRTARLLMNTLLVRGGYQPVIIKDDVEYTKAIIANDVTPGTFAAYLAKVIKMQREEVPQLLAKD